MKTNKKSLIAGILRRGSISGILILTLILLPLGSCNDDDDDNIVIFKAVLNGPNEVPPNSSSATGTATLSYNQDTKIFSITVDYSGLTPTAGHIHKGASGTAGGVVFPLSNPQTSPINYTSPALDSGQEADLMANLYYVNLHTSTFPDGEIRGQLLRQ